MARDTGISSILIFNVDKSLDFTPYCLYFFSSQFNSAFVLLLLLIISKRVLLSFLIILFSFIIKGKTICIKNSFLFLLLSIIFNSLGNNVNATGLTNFFCLTSLRL